MTCSCFCHPHTQYGPDQDWQAQFANHPDCDCLCCRAWTQKETPMLTLTWIDEAGNTCVTRPDVNGDAAFIIAPTSLVTGQRMWLSEIDGPDNIHAVLFERFGRKL